MICEWCGSEGPIIGHHYPVRQSEGGKETVNICHGCHEKCHYTHLVVDANEAETQEEVDKIVHDSELRAIREGMPLLWAKAQEQGYVQSPFELAKWILTAGLAMKRLENKAHADNG